MTLSSPYTRYLRLLGFSRHPTGLEGLRLLVESHLCRVPFENVSKLLLLGNEGAGRAITLEEYLDGIEHFDLGGTCYSCNPYFADLLRALGYNATLLGADMTTPNVHTCIRVSLYRTAYHVDVGFAAPFRQPIPLDRLPHEISEGEQHYLFDRCPGGYQMRERSGEKHIPAYVVHDPPRALDFFTAIIRDSFAPAAHFLNRLRIARFFEDHFVELVNGRMSVHRGDTTTHRELRTLTELEEAIRTDFAMPRCPVAEAVAILERHTGKPFFDAGAKPPSRPAAPPRSSGSA